METTTAGWGASWTSQRYRLKRTTRVPAVGTPRTAGKVRRALVKQPLPGSVELYAALAAGVLALSTGAVLAAGCGLAHADSGRASNSSPSAGDAGKARSAVSRFSRVEGTSPSRCGCPEIRAQVPCRGQQCCSGSSPAHSLSAVPAFSLQAAPQATSATGPTGMTPAVGAVGMLATVGSAAATAVAAVVATSSPAVQQLSSGPDPAPAAAAKVTPKAAAALVTVARSADGSAKSSGAAAVTDSTAALQALFNGLQPGQTLTLAPGTYKRGGVLTINVPNVTINGNGATLQSTNDATSAVSITANGVSLSNLNLTDPLTGPRYSGLNQNSLNIEGNNVSVSNVTITDPALRAFSRDAMMRRS